MDKRALRISSDARPAGLCRFPETKISRNLRAYRIRSGERETRFARSDDGSLCASGGRADRPGEALGRKNTGQPKLRAGNSSPFPEGKAAPDHARSEGVAFGANCAGKYAEDQAIFSVLCRRPLARGGKVGSKNQKQGNAGTGRRL